MTLDKLKIGQEAIVTSIEPVAREGLENSEYEVKKALRRRLLELGLVPSTHVTLIKTAPMGDPLEYRVRNSTLTLRRSDASVVNAEAVSETCNLKTETGKSKNEGGKV